MHQKTIKNRYKHNKLNQCNKNALQHKERRVLFFECVPSLIDVPMLHTALDLLKSSFFGGVFWCRC